MSESRNLEGNVVHFNPKKGIGFISFKELKDDAFFHIKDVIGVTSIPEGERVIAEIHEGDRGLYAKNINMVVA
jgi:cold shock CspA family protein